VPITVAAYYLEEIAVIYRVCRVVSVERLPSAAIDLHLTMKMGESLIGTLPPTTEWVIPSVV
jgi:hypothetical protein